MALASGHVVLANCFSCAVVTGIVLVLQGCGNPHTQCDLDAFKAAAEPCLNAIDLPTDKCMGLSAAKKKCWDMGSAAGGPCFIDDARQWLRDIVDKKFAGAKTAFHNSATECLKTVSFEDIDCKSEQDTNVLNNCWKLAEEAAGGEFKEGNHITAECPFHWLAESVETTHPEHAAWHEKECH